LHESYGFWALPSLFLIFFWARFNPGTSIRESLLAAILRLSPSIVIFFLCLVFKGSPGQALTIHESWQDLARQFPSMVALSAKVPPHGSIDAIGWTTLQGLSMSYSILTGFSYFVWIPLAWLVTLYVCVRLFIGDENKPESTLKRGVILFQFLMTFPLFVLGSDFGRWIFLWIASSALFFGFLSSFSRSHSRALEVVSRWKLFLLTRKIIPGIEMRGPFKLSLVFLGIPMCCWSLGFFWLSSPLGYGYLLVKTARDILLFGIPT